MLKSQLDQRICDCEDNVLNTKTYREYITHTENYFGMCNEPIDEFGEEDLNEYLDFLDELWWK